MRNPKIASWYSNVSIPLLLISLKMCDSQLLSSNMLYFSLPTSPIFPIISPNSKSKLVPSWSKWNEMYLCTEHNKSSNGNNTLQHYWNTSCHVFKKFSVILSFTYLNSFSFLMERNFSTRQADSFISNYNSSLNVIIRILIVTTISAMRRVLQMGSESIEGTRTEQRRGLMKRRITTIGISTLKYRGTFLILVTSRVVIFAERDGLVILKKQ